MEMLTKTLALKADMETQSFTPKFQIKGKNYLQFANIDGVSLQHFLYY